MILLFVSLLIIYLRLNIGIENVSRKEMLCVHVPISVYLGWITVATIANVTAVLVTFGWNGLGIKEDIWTMILISIATIITALVLKTRKDYAYSAVIIWALVGIYLKRMTDDPVYGIQTQIAYTALSAVVIILVLACLFALQQYLKRISTQ
jgi:hypothetical protein